MVMRMKLKLVFTLKNMRTIIRKLITILRKLMTILRNMRTLSSGQLFELFDDEYDAYNLPEEKADYIFSSHCLEHLDSWVEALDYWIEKLRRGGDLFLYLPDYSQEYWRAWNNRKHKNIFSAQILNDFLTNVIVCPHF